MPRSLNSNGDAYPGEDVGWGFNRLKVEPSLRAGADKDESDPEGAELNIDLDADTDEDDKSDYENATANNPHRKGRQRPEKGDKTISVGRRSPTLRAKESAIQAASEKAQLSPWEVCYLVNISFQKKITGPWQCVSCSRTGFATSPEYRSNFVTVVATCPDGHKDHLSSLGATGKKIACSRCDEDFALRVSQQTVKCFHPMCLRMLVVDWELVKWANEGDDWQDTLKQYSKLLEKNPKFDCIVCLETLPIAERPGRAPTRKCKHSPNVCRGCLSDMLKHAVGTGNFKELKCPAAGTDKCEGLLNGKDVAEFADRDTFKKYDNFMMDDLLKSNPTYRWCQKRNDGGICGWGQLHPTGDTVPRWECQKCNASNCFNCRILWHEGLTCKQYQLRMENDLATLELLQKTTKKCPGCGRRIEKRKFCKDMKCRKSIGGCGIKFCWACKLIYKPSKQHLRDCPQFRGTASRPTMPNAMYRDDWYKDPGYIPSPDEYDMRGYAGELPDSDEDIGRRPRGRWN